MTYDTLLNEESQDAIKELERSRAAQDAAKTEPEGMTAPLPPATDVVMPGDVLPAPHTADASDVIPPRPVGHVEVPPGHVPEHLPEPGEDLPRPPLPDTEPA